MGSSDTRDSVLDRILGKPGRSKQYRKATDSLANALEEAGIKHKGLPNVEDEVDEELLSDLQLVYAMHKAKKKPPFMAKPDDAEEEDAEKDYDEEEKSQPGYGEVDDSEPEATPALVSTAITKKPGNFPPPVSHQQRTGKALKPAPRQSEKVITESEFATVMKELVQEIDTFKSEHAQEMKELVEFMDAVKSNMAFTPRQASAAPETVEESPEMIKAIKAMNSKPDSFWQTNLPA